MTVSERVASLAQSFNQIPAEPDDCRIPLEMHSDFELHLHPLCSTKQDASLQQTEYLGLMHDEASLIYLLKYKDIFSFILIYTYKYTLLVLSGFGLI